MAAGGKAAKPVIGLPKFSSQKSFFLTETFYWCALSEARCFYYLKRGDKVIG